MRLMKHFDLTEAVPLTQNEDGTVRVIGSRILLDTIVGCFEQGDKAEDIQDGFPTLSLAQIKAVIAWYLSNQAEVQEYIAEREAEGERLRQEIESRPGYVSLSELRRRREQSIKI
jgi:uncharacterized protein (DUF433 family)